MSQTWLTESIGQTSTIATEYTLIYTTFDTLLGISTFAETATQSTETFTSRPTLTVNTTKYDWEASISNTASFVAIMLFLVLFTISLALFLYRRYGKSLQKNRNLLGNPYSLQSSTVLDLFRKKPATMFDFEPTPIHLVKASRNRKQWEEDQDMNYRLSMDHPIILQVGNSTPNIPSRPAKNPNRKSQ